MTKHKYQTAKVCEYCSDTYLPKHATVSRFCSAKCRVYHRRARFKIFRDIEKIHEKATAVLKNPNPPSVLSQADRNRIAVAVADLEAFLRTYDPNE